MALSAIEAMDQHDARIALESPMSIELIRIDLEKRYSNYPHDPEKLIEWSQTLVELSQFGTETTATQMVKGTLSCPGNEDYRKSLRAYATVFN
ncbi:hypothetical protein L2E82_34602 [Cichorium intybus]|uniref:Uncharacterized protein n=1 Tax=Cichorium intybus TaxID=13427 RepID=A0ACB9BMF1_CICIN|nr:hypothetical protein L2E82_34602 [Cichorium intybus]